ncbi:MAG: transcription antitermination factor NusB [Leptospira sp.]|jgi:transcription antitermination protein NusB|nr:transcription antitermination factor NusB [Leptospira sp.]NCS95174.1 transcription antitermination factor NusB [Leptospira sp.]
MASRHRGRVLALMGLYQTDLVEASLKDVLTFAYFDKPTTQEEREHATFLIKGVVDNWEKIDTIIKENSANWELSRISIVNRSILRLSIFSMMQEEWTPAAVIIDEALLLTREYESEESVGFINGILDSIKKKLHP